MTTSNEIYERAGGFKGQWELVGKGIYEGGYTLHISLTEQNKIKMLPDDGKTYPGTLAAVESFNKRMLGTNGDGDVFEFNDVYRDW